MIKTISIRLIKIVAFVCFVLIAAALFIIHNSPAIGYELSFYSSVSPLVWIFLIFSIIGGITILVSQAFAEDKQSRWWLAGFAVLIMAYFVIGIIPPLRGYVIYGRGDILSHVGMVQDIMQDGRFNQYNYYPIMHTLVAQISQICNIEYIAVMNYLPTLYAVLYVLGIYLLSSVVFSDRGIVLMVTACGTLLIAWGSVTLATRYGCFPTSLSILIVPIILFIYFKSVVRKSIAFSLLLILLLICSTFFHPLSAMVLMIYLIIIELSKVLYRRTITNKMLGQYNLTIARANLNLSPALILFISLFTWMVPFAFFVNRLQGLDKWLSGELDIGRGEMLANRLMKAELDIGESVVLFFKLYGDIFIYGILAILAVILILTLYRKTICEWIWRIMALAGCFFISGLLFVLLLFPNIIAPMRILGFVSVCSTVLAGFVLYSYFKRRVHYQSIAVLVLAIAAIIGIFHTYNSPYTIQPNAQITHMEMEGYGWAITHGDQKASFLSFGISPINRFAEFTLGFHLVTEREDLPRKIFVQDHFNYGQYRTYGESLNEDIYMVVDRASILAYTTLWTQIDRFSKDDFEILKSDPSVCKLYSNRGVAAYRVYTTVD